MRGNSGAKLPAFPKPDGWLVRTTLSGHFIRRDVKPPACGSVLFMACVVKFFFFHLLNDVQVRARCLAVSVLEH